MGFEFHPDQWLRIMSDYPVLLVLLAGLVGGAGVTQLVKRTYLGFVAAADRVSEPRYRVSVMWLAVLSTGLLTGRIWDMMIGDHHTGLHHAVAVVAGVSAPYVYRITKAVVGWKFPAFAKAWGDEP